MRQIPNFVKNIYLITYVLESGKTRFLKTKYQIIGPTIPPRYMIFFFFKKKGRTHPRDKDISYHSYQKELSKSNPCRADINEKEKLLNMNLPLYSLSFKIKGGLELDDSYEGHNYRCHYICGQF